MALASAPWSHGTRPSPLGAISCARFASSSGRHGPTRARAGALTSMRRMAHLQGRRAARRRASLLGPGALASLLARRSGRRGTRARSATGHRRRAAGLFGASVRCGRARRQPRARARSAWPDAGGRGHGPLHHAGRASRAIQLRHGSGEHRSAGDRCQRRTRARTAGCPGERALRSARWRSALCARCDARRGARSARAGGHRRRQARPLAGRMDRGRRRGLQM